MACCTFRSHIESLVKRALRKGKTRSEHRQHSSGAIIDVLGEQRNLWRIHNLLNMRTKWLACKPRPVRDTGVWVVVAWQSGTTMHIFETASATRAFYRAFKHHQLGRYFPPVSAALWVDAARHTRVPLNTPCPMCSRLPTCGPRQRCLHGFLGNDPHIRSEPMRPVDTLDITWLFQAGPPIAESDRFPLATHAVVC